MRKLIYLKKGFTLAEVLITLGIIGIVAAMTIPTVLQNAQNQATVSALKKSYSALSQAYTLAVQDNGTPDTWGLTVNSAGNTKLFQILFSPYLKITKNCDNGTGCFPTTPYQLLNGAYVASDFDSNTQYARFQMADGTIMLFNILSANCSTNYGNSQSLQNICGYFYIDTNGLKKPNQYGKDWFSFYITKYGIIPLGTQQQSTDNNFDNECKDKSTAHGYGCAAWVIYNENMDYLKCNTLSWDGPTKCP